jgi:hypothetical protein
MGVEPFVRPLPTQSKEKFEYEIILSSCIRFFYIFKNYMEDKLKYTYFSVYAS